MILDEIFGNGTRIKVLQELLTKDQKYISAEELSRMADISLKTAYNHINQLNKTGILKTINDGGMKIKLNVDDKRVIFLSLIESEEYLRQNNISEDEINNEYGEIEVKPNNSKNQLLISTT